MTALTSLLARINTPAALDALQLSWCDTTEPATGPCYGCQQPGWYHRDPWRNAYWFACPHCHAHGNILEIAAACWKVEIAEAILRMQGLGLLEGPGDGEIHAHLQQQQQQQTARDWLQRWAERFERSSEPAIERLCRRVGVPRGQHVSELNRRQPVVGVGLPREITSGQPGKERRSANYQICLPFCDMPQHITGFLTFRSSSGGTLETNWRPLQASAPITDAGLFQLQSLVEPHPLIGDCGFVTDDPRLALELHAISTATSRRESPLAAGLLHGQPSPELWRGIPLKRLVFWSTSWQPGILLSAAACDGYVCCLDTSRAAILEQVAAQPVIDWLRRVGERAIPWRSAVKQYLAQADLKVCRTLLYGLARLGHDVTRLAEELELPEERRNELPRLVDVIHPDHNRPLQLSEYQGRWFLGDTQRLLANFTLRVDQLLHVENDERLYRGRVLFGSRQIPFLLPVAMLLGSKRPLLAIDRHVQDQTGLVLSYSQTWEPQIFTGCLEISPPQAISAVAHVGWDRRHDRLLFPEFCLRRGSARPEPLERLTDGPYPLAGYPDPWTCGPERHLAIVGHDTAAARLFWSLAAICVQRLLAPVLGGEPASVVVLTPQGGAVQWLATALGCPAVHTEASLRHYQQHAWPLFSGRDLALLGEAGSRCGIATTDYEPATWLLDFAQGWHVLRAPQLGLPGKDQRLGEVVLAYLADLCGRGLRLPTTDGSVPVQLLTDMLGWLEREHGRKLPVDRVLADWSSPGTMPRDELAGKLAAPGLAKQLLRKHRLPLDLDELQLVTTSS